MEYYWLIVVFLLGTAVGSFLNVVIARLPREKSIIWPGSHCGSCFQPIRWYDNLPLLGYLWLRGRCRTCGTRFSIRYFAVEFLTGLLFAGLFYLEVIRNVHHWPLLNGPFFFYYPGPYWAGFLYDAALMSFLLAAAGCDMSGQREIPFVIPMTGTIVGLIGAALMPFPWPRPPSDVPQPLGLQLMGAVQMLRDIQFGVQFWPFWWPVPEWFVPGTWRMGLATGLAGMLMGSFMLRAIAFIFAKGMGKEGLGLGDADLMMMVGSFLGWQLVVVAFFVSVIPGLFLGIFQMIVKKDNAMPFGPSLAAGSMITCVAWSWIGPKVQFMFYWGQMMLVLAAICAVFLLISSLALRMMKR
jgi:leader peptidase (prepilin peptidase)/N-methyltransferase